MPRWAPSEAQGGEAGTGAQPHPGRAIRWPRPQHCRQPTGRSFPPGHQPQGPLLICRQSNLLPWNLLPGDKIPAWKGTRGSGPRPVLLCSWAGATQVPRRPAVRPGDVSDSKTNVSHTGDFNLARETRDVL